MIIQSLFSPIFPLQFPLSFQEFSTSPTPQHDPWRNPTSFSLFFPIVLVQGKGRSAIEFPWLEIDLETDDAQNVRRSKTDR